VTFLRSNRQEDRRSVMRVSPVKLGIIVFALAALASTVLATSILLGPQTKVRRSSFSAFMI